MWLRCVFLLGTDKAADLQVGGFLGCPGHLNADENCNSLIEIPRAEQSRYPLVPRSADPSTAHHPETVVPAGVRTCADV